MQTRAHRPTHPDPARLQAARQRLHDRGEVDAALLGDTLARSWRRCLDAGLVPQGRGSGSPHASAPQLARARERSQVLLDLAAPLVELLLPAVHASGSLLLLADGDGTVLQAAGDERFADRAQRVALRPGACWSEALRGSNAIGSAIAERRPAVVHGAEHYLARNAFLSCCAAPVFDPAGAVAAVVDLTGHRRAQPLQATVPALALAGLAARLLTQRLFDTLPAALWRIALHPQRSGLGTPAQGLLAMHDDGTLAALDEVARELLGAPPLQPGALLCERLALPAPALRAVADRGQPLPLTLPDGRILWLQLRRPAT